MERLTRDKVLERDFVAAVRDAPDDEAMWQRLAEVALGAARRVLYPDLELAWHGAAICYAVQMGPRLEFSSESQAKLVKNVAEVLGK